MNHIKHQLLTVLACLLLSSLSYAYDGLDLYGCVISDKDRYNSKGVRLTKVRDILAQDRANYHRFKRRDVHDHSDFMFHTAANRRLWQTVKITIDPTLRRKILYGGDVEITVFVLTEDWIDVTEGFLDPNVG